MQTSASIMSSGSRPIARFLWNNRNNGSNDRISTFSTAFRVQLAFQMHDFDSLCSSELQPKIFVPSSLLMLIVRTRCMRRSSVEVSRPHMQQTFLYEAKITSRWQGDMLATLYSKFVAWSLRRIEMLSYRVLRTHTCRALKSLMYIVTVLSFRINEGPAAPRI